MPSFTYAGRNVEFVGTYTGSYNCINKGRFYELPFLEHVRALDLGGTYLDVGTNIGNHAVYFAAFCPSEQVIGFEPVARWRSLALSNLAANGCEGKSKVFPTGLLDRTGAIDFNPYGTSMVLNCRTLDESLPDLTGVSLMKMDIEGSEPQALLGGKEFFKRNRPLIYAEVLGSPETLLAAAFAVGYRHSGVVLGGATPMYELVPAS